ncbi:Uncharacterized protein TCM_035669 [Theobroma cacao]|uniref:Uncharacterized protein n=1 Tax=Theobroma cacao TaxID=3641 RepID=A0A061FQJ0_THECC|nr:Uncharacterized protein TCM_035669 [Theobroma cacao]
MLQMANTGIEQENVESLLCVPRHRWGFNTGINIHCKRSHLHVIREMLCQVNELESFKRTCFGHMMDVEAYKSLFCASLVHNLMLHRINELNATEVELWLAIRKTKARFSNREFYLVTGLKFGPLLAHIVNPYEAFPGGIHLRYWGLGKELWAVRMLEPTAKKMLTSYWADIERRRTTDEEVHSDFDAAEAPHSLPATVHGASPTAPPPVSAVAPPPASNAEPRNRALCP